jgi:hypothetical protein
MRHPLSAVLIAFNNFPAAHCALIYYYTCAAMNVHVLVTLQAIDDTEKKEVRSKCWVLAYMLANKQTSSPLFQATAAIIARKLL